MTTALDSFRDPPLEIDPLSVSYLAPFTGGFTGGPPCNPQLDDIAGSNAFFSNLCATVTNFPPAGQMQPPKAFFGRLFDFTTIVQTCPTGVFTRLQFHQFQGNDPKFIPLPAGGPPYDRIFLPTYTSPALVVMIFANVASNAPQPTSVQLGVIDDSNNIDVAISAQPSIGFAATMGFLASTGTSIGLAVNPTGNPFIVNNTVNWPTFEIFIVGQL